MKVGELNREVKLLEIVHRGKSNPAVNQGNKTVSFKDTFSQELARGSEVNFSKHARQRLFSRGIELSNAKLNQLSQAIDRAAVKGSKDTLILDNDAAYVVSVPDRMVVTAVSTASLREGVFTSIDSAVIL